MRPGRELVALGGGVADDLAVGRGGRRLGGDRGRSRLVRS